MKEAIDIMHVITICLDESYSSEVVRKEAKPLIDMFNSISDNYNAIYLFDNLNGDYVTTIRIGLDVRGIIEYTDDADYVKSLDLLSSKPIILVICLLLKERTLNQKFISFMTAPS